MDQQGYEERAGRYGELARHFAESLRPVRSVGGLYDRAVVWWCGRVAKRARIGASAAEMCARRHGMNRACLLCKDWAATTSDRA